MPDSDIPTNPVLVPSRRAERQAPPGYEIVSELGRGGMGVVYKARQTVLDRVVALKMILPGPHADETEQLRFLAEAEAVAAVRHPNVVQVYEFGTFWSRVPGGEPVPLPYFAMELLAGGSLARALDARPLAPAEAARVVEAVARGVQAAHDVGVVHRDLKPANVLLGEDGVPRVTDFGLAKRGGGYDLTQTGLVMGTPAYMAPEQAAGRTKFVGPAADVWALGAILYECLTGRTPFQSGDALEQMRRAVQEEPDPVRRYAPAVPRDLEAVCLRCLNKAPFHRYPTAGELADDLARFRAGEPVSVRPPGAVEKAVKWVRRRPTRAAAYGLALVAAGLLGLTAAVGTLWKRAETARTETAVALDQAEAAGREAGTERDRAEQARREADTARAAAERALASETRLREEAAAREVLRAVELAHRQYEAGNVGEVHRLLGDCSPHLRTWEWRYVRQLATRERASVALAPGFIHKVVPAPDGSVYSAGAGGVRRWVGGTATVFAPGTARALAISADGKRLAAEVAPPRPRSEPDRWEVRVFELPSGRPVVTLPTRASALSLNATGDRLVTVSGKAVVWDVARGAPVATVQLPNSTTCAALDPGGTRLAVGGTAAPTPPRAGQPPVLPRDLAVRGLAAVYDAGTGARLSQFDGHTRAVTAVAFDPDGKRLVSASEDGTAKVWDWAAGRELCALIGHNGPVLDAAFAPDGRTAVTGGEDRSVRVWWTGNPADPVAPNRENGVPERLTLRGHGQPVRTVTYAPDGRLLSADEAGVMKTWDATAADTVLITSHRIWATAATVSPDGTRLYLGGTVSPLLAADAATGKVLWRRTDGPAVRALRLDPTGAKLTAVTEDGHRRDWDAATGEPLGPLEKVLTLGSGGRLGAAAPDLSRFLVRTATGGIEVRDGSDAPAGGVGAFTGQLYWSALTPGGAKLVTGGQDRVARVWDTTTGRELFALYGHTARVKAVAVSPDGSRAATGSEDGVIKVWDMATGRELLSLRGRGRYLSALGFSPDGSRLVSVDMAGCADVYSAAPGK